MERLDNMAHFLPCNNNIGVSIYIYMVFNEIVTISGLPKMVMTLDKDAKFLGHYWRTL